MSDRCFFCDEDRALDRHHIVPRRFGGSDKDENLVTVCPTCHRKLETLYDDRFYEQVWAAERQPEPPGWWWDPGPHGEMTLGEWAEFAVVARDALQNSIGFDRGQFCNHYYMTHPGAIIDEPDEAWEALRDRGVIYPRPDGAFDVNDAMIEAYKDAEKPDPDTLPITEMMSDE